MGEYIRFIETEITYDSLVWVCEECNEPWILMDGTPQENEYNYCPKCGRKIIEYVQFQYNDEGEDEC